MTPEQFATKGIRVIVFIGAQLMNTIDGFRSRHEGGADHFQGAGDVVVVGSRHADSQREHRGHRPKYGLGTALAPISGVRTAQLASRRSGHHLTVDAFPAPLNVPLSMDNTLPSSIPSPIRTRNGLKNRVNHSQARNLLKDVS